MSQILFIAFHFPPKAEIASVRAKGLATHLPALGYTPTILTTVLPTPPDPQFDVVETEYPGDATDIFLKKISRSSTRVTREEIAGRFSVLENKRAIGPFFLRTIRSFVEFPDNQRYWYRNALDSGRQILSRGQYKAILSTSYPVTSHLVAAKLVDEYKLPWIADMRDLWTQSHLRPYGRLRNLLESRLELRTLEKASALVTVSQPLADKLSAFHKRNVCTITNGFDSAERISVAPTDAFTITYTGRIHPVFQDPTPLFKAVGNLLREDVIERHSIHLRFYGRKEIWLERAISDHGLQDVAVQYGQQDRAFVQERQRESQVLLLLDWTDKNEKGVYTGKVFEYLAASRPIFVVGAAAGVLLDLMQQTNAGVYCRSASEVEVCLRQMLTQFKVNGRVAYRGKAKEIDKYSHREMAHKFADILNTIVPSKS